MELIRSPETELLVKVFREMEKGSSLTDAQLNETVKFDVTKYRHNARTAYEIVRNEGHGDVYRVPKFGYRKRLDTEVVTVAAPAQRRKIQNAARRASAKLAGVDFDTLSDTDKSAHNSEQAYFGVVRLFGGAKALAAVRAATSSVALPPRDVLKLFSKGKP